jgi:hypothetical protein
VENERWRPLLEFVEVDKGYVGKRPRTWIRLSPTGRSALGRHVAALQRIAATAAEQGTAHRVERGPATA